MSRSIEAHQGELRALLARAAPDDATETVPLARAAGRVLARDLVAPLDLPPHTNAQMDGFAVRVSDLAAVPPDGGIDLPVTAIRAAGAAPAVHTAGAATAVMTGAVIPEGADAVVPVERVSPPRFDTPLVTVPGSVARDVAEGAFVRAAGSDVARGAVALPAGTLLGAAALGACAALGLTDTSPLPVRQPPRVVVVSGGDEIRPAGETLPPGAVHDANGPLLAAWLRAAGVDSVTRLGVDDDPDAFLARLGDVVARVRPHLVITSGGISAGAFEVVRLALGRAGREMWFGHVAVQPGGPQGCGTLLGVPVVCLPGNPVSTWVSCELFVRPALAAVWGCCEPPRWFTARLQEPVQPLPDRTQLRRGVLDHSDCPPRVSLAGGASSHLLTAAARADALVRIAPGAQQLPAGTPLAVLPVAGGPRAGAPVTAGGPAPTNDDESGEPR
ncbi:molybdopterin molybdotransferase MoeA [Kocuria tytonis]|uniref:Molybdopterin molybdenumtransferase n=1 Tax=Kocuria tytonis TaxID=2054280 RepID=A0A495ABS2_9MICC|nr:gephyrin-like molybdotransferase Glp [Kocuria tytonis]RKQ36954.1 molybdopterin molybdenumtransferase MoeA [Kocuria tytonis]